MAAETAEQLISSPLLLEPQEAYDLAAPYYDDWKWQQFWKATEQPVVLDELFRFAAERNGHAELVDVGCGTGNYLAAVEDGFRRVVGIDLSPKMLSVARHRLAGKELVRGDATALPFGAGQFDCILCTRVLSHIERPWLAIAEMARVIRAGGLLLISDVSAAHSYEHTKLPAGDFRVLARTFKHPLSAVMSYALNAGLSASRVVLIDERGRQGRSDPGVIQEGESTLGWITAWARGQ
jgi:ubiquinone/menaquinone biosynthesis C-methylase UbiE